MPEEKRKGRPKLTAKDIGEQHAFEIDPLDAKGRTRYRRYLDDQYAGLLILEDPDASPVARGVAAKQVADWADRAVGKPVTPVDMTTTVVHKSVEESAASILEMIGQKRKATEQVPQPTKPQTIQ